MATDYRVLLKKYIKFVFELAGTDYTLHRFDDAFSEEEIKTLHKLSDEIYLETE